MIPVDTPQDVDALSPLQLVRLWLAAGYLYEIEGETLIPDPVWDHLCARLLAEWDAATAADTLGHSVIIDPAALPTATAGYIKAGDYPPFARGLASRLMFEWRGRVVPYRTGLTGWFNP